MLNSYEYFIFFVINVKYTKKRSSFLKKYYICSTLRKGPPNLTLITMLKLFKTTLALLALGMLATGCSSDNNDDNNAATDDTTVQLTPGEIRLTTTQKQLVVKGNDFAFSAMQKLNDSKKDGFVFSPMSISYLLGMVADGADGATRTEIINALGAAGKSRQALNSFYANIILNAPNVDKDVTLEISDAFFGNTLFPARLSESYNANLQDYFKALVEYCDFSKTQATVDRINEWCGASSHGMIKSIGLENVLDAMWANVMLSCAYFSGAWTQAFSEEDTQEMYFTKADGSKQLTPMMRKIDEVLFMEDSKAKAISMPYGEGDYQMLLAMPAAGSIDDFIASLSGSRFDDIRKKLDMAATDILMPAFSAKTEEFLRSTLSDLGIVTMFSPDADFSPMYDAANGRQPIGDIKHVAAIEVDEHGTKAAAISSTWRYTASPGEEQAATCQFHALSPFVYIIYQQSTGAIFFMGKYNGK